MEIYSRDMMTFDKFLSLERAQARNSSLSAMLNGVMVHQLGNISRSIDGLALAFAWGLGEILLRLDMQHESLKDIREKLEAPLDTQAKELRRRAEYAYDNGWFEEALVDFLESERKNYQDFWVHEAIANIYLYHREPPDLQKSREYYLKLAKYASPVSQQVAAKGYLYAGFVCYLQKDDQSAIDNASKATMMYPDLIEAFYNHAKFSAAAGRADLAIPSLETAIHRERNYLEQASKDPDFAQIAPAVSVLMANCEPTAVLRSALCLK